MIRNRRGLGLAGVVALAAGLGTPTAGAAQVAAHEGVAEALAVVETWLDAQLAYERIPSLSAAIVHDQELVWSGAMGMAHPARGMEATPETLYSICSISKLFTSVALMQLRDRGLVDLRDPVSDHLPWYAVAQRHDTSAPVTVQGILTHSAGLPGSRTIPTGPVRTSRSRAARRSSTGSRTRRRSIPPGGRSSIRTSA
jgi:CubicO group peptidase (beta-lactamase class C family)